MLIICLYLACVELLIINHEIACWSSGCNVSVSLFVPGTRLSHVNIDDDSLVKLDDVKTEVTVSAQESSVSCVCICDCTKCCCMYFMCWLFKQHELEIPKHELNSKCMKFWWPLALHTLHACHLNRGLHLFQLRGELHWCGHHFSGRGRGLPLLHFLSAHQDSFSSESYESVVSHS